jgi:hypothetical protein
MMSLVFPERYEALRGFSSSDGLPILQQLQLSSRRPGAESHQPIDHLVQQ